MSSFVINKKEYAEACGFLAGLAEVKGRYNEPVLRLWNYARNRVYTPEDFLKVSAWLYDLNAISVQKQYRDSEKCTDSNDYRAEFENYKQRTIETYLFHKSDLKKAIYRFHMFSSCILYQIEDKECDLKAKGFLYRVNHLLMGIMRDIDQFEVEDSWASFDLS